MSAASGPLKSKGESLFEKAKEVIGDLWNQTTDKAEDLKEIAEEKIEELKGKITNKKAATVKEVTAVKPLASGKSTLKKTTESGIKAKVTSAKSVVKTGSAKKAAIKKAVAKKSTPATAATKKKVVASK